LKTIATFCIQKVVVELFLNSLQDFPMEIRTADKIRESLEQGIIEGLFSEGERLDEVRLAATYGVSRTPFREALQMLAGSGLVTLIPRRGAYVRHPGLVELIEMFEVMTELEALCGRLAARRVSSAELVPLTFAVQACQKACDQDDIAAYYYENEKFHQLIYKASGNNFLAAEAEKLQKRLRPFRRFQLLTQGRMAESMREHRAILEALGSSDEQATIEAIRTHVSLQGQRFNNLLASYEKNGAPRPATGEAGKS
jgi:DNA-binding GntR family transcriptional regulator